MKLEVSVKQICVQRFSKAWPHLLLQLLDKLISWSCEVPLQNLRNNNYKQTLIGNDHNDFLKTQFNFKTLCPVQCCDDHYLREVEEDEFLRFFH